MTDNLAFIDTETTGLDPDHHQIWEVGAIIDDREHIWHLPVDLGRADPTALNIGRFHERYGKLRVNDERLGISSLREFVNSFANLTRGRHLVGAVVSFDEERLRRLMRANSQCPMWHHRMIDVESLALGFFGPQPDSGGLPRSLSDTAAALGIEVPEADHHSALGDARTARAVYEMVMAPR